MTTAVVSENMRKRAPTLGTAAWKRMLVTGMGAEDSMEMITTSTSGRDGGQSRAKVNNTRRLCLSNTETGNKVPEIDEQKYVNQMNNKKEDLCLCYLHIIKTTIHRLKIPAFHSADCAY